MTTLYLQTGHDAAAVFHDAQGKLRVLEVERFNRIRYSLLTIAGDYKPDKLCSFEDKVSFFKHIQDIAAPITKVVYHNHSGKITIDEDLPLLPTDNVELRYNHHLYHAASGFYSSPFRKALILSIDGGGNSSEDPWETMSFINVYEGNNTIQHKERYTQNIGCAYGALGHFLQEIKGDHLFRLDFAGKIMGLCAYGKIQYDWIPHFIEYFKSSHETLWDEEWIESKVLSQKIGLPLVANSLSGQTSYDFMATAQYAFEEVILEIMSKYFHEYNNFVLTGGCALNVLLNQRVKKILRGMGKDLYVPPDPNDCGLALGMYLLDHGHTSIDVFSGFDILDREILAHEVQKRGACRANYKDLAHLISQGKIVGVVEGYSEIGPRALGHRSIICDPSLVSKDTLNARVKFREWFRPFAPVCKFEDMHEFFDDVYESSYMSYAPVVRPKYRQKLAAVCHEDNTARLQTVRDGIFYEILSHMKIPVLLNTSFNIKGKPILTRIADALECLDTTELDCVYIEGWLFSK